MVRRVTAAIGVCLLMAIGAGCGGDDDGSSTSGTSTSSASASGEKFRLGVSMIDLSNPFFVSMRDAGLKAAEDYGVEANFQSADGSLEKQISVVENFIAQKVDALLINAVDDKGIIPVLRKAESAGIPVIMMANDVKDPYPYKTLYPDYDNMAMQARVLGTWLDGQGQVALLIGSRGNSVSDAREAGFAETMRAEFPDIETVATLPTDWDAAKGSDVAETILTQHPDVQAIGCVSDPPCLGAITVAQRDGADVKWGGYDGDANLHPMLEDGTMLMDVLTGAERVGYWNVALAARILEGSKFPKTVYLPTFFVSSEEIGTQLQEKGLDYEFITPEQATVEATNYEEQFGPDASDESLDQGQEGRVK